MLMVNANLFFSQYIYMYLCEDGSLFNLNPPFYSLYFSRESWFDLKFQFFQLNAFKKNILYIFLCGYLTLSIMVHPTLGYNDYNKYEPTLQEGDFKHVPPFLAITIFQKKNLLTIFFRCSYVNKMAYPLCPTLHQELCF